MGIIGGTRKSGNILISGRSLRPSEYRIVAPYLGMPLDKRIRNATGVRSFGDYRQRLEARQTRPTASFIFNTPCNIACDFCHFDTTELPTMRIDWNASEERMLAAQKSGYQVKVYFKEFNASPEIFGRAIGLMDKTGETFAITNGERGFDPAELLRLASSTLRHIVVSLLPRTQLTAARGRDSYGKVADTIKTLANFSRGMSPRPFTVGIFTQVDIGDLGSVLEMAIEARRLGADTLNFRLTKPIGNARQFGTGISNKDLDDFLLAFIDARKSIPKEQLQLLLSSATFGPNYYAQGMLRYQLGLDSDPYYSSKYPCPFLDDGKSFSILMPSNRLVFCQSLVASDFQVTQTHIDNPANICRACDALAICKGGCVANRILRDDATRLADTSVCLTETFRRWEGR